MASKREIHEARKAELQAFGKDLAKRAKSRCEICQASTSLEIYEVPPVKDPEFEKCVMICETCLEQLENPEAIEPNHWRCLNEAVWSETPAVQVLAWRQLQNLQEQGWAQDLLEQVYLDEAVLEWAQAISGGNALIFRDSNGTPLAEGDTVSLIKDLDVKGTSFVAKRGTTVKNIRLTDNSEHVEGRINNTTLVLKTCFLKKVN
ncbi:PhnA domain protein [bacterium (Candidatus Blackallbacteria) CG17_big_fil_post_rev_8_21_14_2_50_48_46]|uniref:PhnA domain protein n=1 Tax=bacterium (Candidatus Blackallbacteria) CG17_big_fil_post_rev_8_21_14_2_50_48_46 TaxID=2014261 RepID=A0A2M7G834_9BACT|nr:MAG: PhnA domain protein [bacterium (Candidatus Blackallbacteria) CG18_big_fil_WC_8_21_14_2_50_49_26]PIW18247.1 MAG: PhnA domain protein [bacterium (Candidatus Blackallbacteria) CG17_big_fil_post_rev_8_21_14_2_50_48_46]PIW50678.1 MAG: PhnA domain protein [bacterium (Candidatus Blackallbacteria) CG13_big_fil_rev_8_21_14_2_50_49_14]